MALRGEVVDLVRLHLLNDANQISAVGQVAIVQDELAVIDMRVSVQMINAVSVEQRAAPLDAVDDITFF